MPDDLTITAWLKANAEGLVATFLEAQATVAETTKGMSESIKSLGESAESVQRIFTGFGAAIVGSFIAEQVEKLATTAADYSEEITHMQAKTGMGVEALQELRYAATEAGVNFESLGRLFMGMQRHLSTMQSGAGGGQLQASMARLHMSVSDLQHPMEGLLKLSDDMQGSLQNQAKYMQVLGDAQKVFGFGIRQIAPLLIEGRAAIMKWAEDAHKAGMVLSAGQIEAGLELEHAIKGMTQQWEAFKLQLSEAVLPIVYLVTEAMSKLGLKLTGIAESPAFKEGIKAIGHEMIILAAEGVAAFEWIGREIESVINVLDVLHKSLLAIEVVVDTISGHLDDATAAFDELTGSTAGYGDLVKNVFGTDAIKRFDDLMEEASKKASDAVKLLEGGGTAATPRYVSPEEQAKGVAATAEFAAKSLDIVKASWEQQLEVGKVSKAQELEALKDIAGQEYEIQKASLEKQITLLASVPKAQEAMYAKLEVLESKHAADQITEQTKILKAQQDADDKTEKSATDRLVSQLTAEQKFLTSLAKLHGDNGLQVLEIERSYDDQIEKAKEDSIVRQMAGLSTGSDQYAKLYDELLKLHQDYLNKQLTDSASAAEQEKAIWDENFKAITGALSPVLDTFDKAFDLMLSRTRHKSLEMKKMFLELAESVIKSGIKDLLLGGEKGTAGGAIFGTTGGLVGAGAKALGLDKMLQTAFSSSEPIISKVFGAAFRGAQSLINTVFGTAFGAAKSVAGSAIGAAASAAGPAASGAGGAAGAAAASLNAIAQSTSQSATSGLQTIAMLPIHLAQLLLHSTLLGGLFSQSLAPHPMEITTLGTIGVLDVVTQSLGFTWGERGGILAEGGPAMLHAKEMVLPAHISTGLQDMIRGGGNGGDTHHVTINHSVHTIDAKSFSDRLDQHKSDIADAWMSAMRSGHRGLTGAAARGRA